MREPNGQGQRPAAARERRSAVWFGVRGRAGPEALLRAPGGPYDACHNGRRGAKPGAAEARGHVAMLLTLPGVRAKRRRT
jgi:hypothetical protein